jgi:hypothetical protein
METTRFSGLWKGLALILCRLILPLLTVFLMLIMPGFTSRQPVQSTLFDAGIRFALTVFFCTNYWYLPKLFDPKSKRWLGISKTILDDPILLKGFYLFMTIGYGFFTAGFTFYAFSNFLPTVANYRFVAAIINGLIFVTSFAIRYKAFMELAASQEL